MQFKQQENISNNIPDEDIEPEYDQEYQFILNTHKRLYDIDPENAPPISVLESWKDFHKNIYISTVVDPNQYYLWRVMTRQEYKKLNTNNSFSNPMSANEIIVETCLLYPNPQTPEWRLKSPAGIIESLGKQIAYQSGFVPDSQLISMILVI